mgnify:CR=1 FL=1
MQSVNQKMLPLYYYSYYMTLYWQANAASGVAVDDDCKIKFLDLKSKRCYRYIIYKIDPKAQKVVIEKLGGPEEAYDAFTGSLPENDCRYAIYDYEFVTPDNCQKSKIFFFAWYKFNKNLPSLVKCKSKRSR